MEARSSTGRRGNGPQLVIDGYYGIQSQGDDAMLLALVEGIRERVPDVGVTVLSRNPRDLRRRYGLRALRNFDHPPFVPSEGTGSTASIPVSPASISQWCARRSGAAIC